MEFLLIIRLISKIKIHFLFYVFALIAIITGLFNNFILFTLLILVHELGHIIPALYFKWNIDKIVILPFGGLTIFKEHLNKPLFEEFLILISGPIFQMIFFFITSEYIDNNLYYNFHYSLLVFNFLPIYPLDGSKLLNIIFNKFLPFKKSYKLVLNISFILIFTIGIIMYNNLIIIFIFSFLIFHTSLEKLKVNYIFNKFLFERYLYNFNFRKQKIIKNKKTEKMFRDFRHLFLVNKDYITERQVLIEEFEKK